MPTRHQSGGPLRAAAFFRTRPPPPRPLAHPPTTFMKGTSMTKTAPLTNSAIADAGRIRMGDCMRKAPAAKPPVSIADSGRIRMGDCMRSFAGARGR